MDIRLRFAHIARAFAFLLLALPAMTVASCDDGETRLEPVPYQVADSIYPPVELTFNQVKDSLLKKGGLTEGELDEESLRRYSSQIDLAAMRARKYNAHVVTYHTTDPNGHPVIASGVVYYPRTGKPIGVIEALSFNKNKDDCPSRNIANVEVIQGMSGYIVITSDQIGSGSTEDMHFPYLNHDNITRVCADMRAAATELVRNVYGRAMPQYTIVTGFSLAAAEALALACHYDKHPELGVQVNEVWMSGGPYNPLTILDEQLQSRYAEYAFIPNVIYSLNHYEELGLDLSKVFAGELSKHYEDWCTGHFHVHELSYMLGTDVSRYLNMDFFTDTNPEYQRMRAAMQNYVLSIDERPSCTIHLYHGQRDEYVTIKCAEELAAQLRAVGADLDYVVTNDRHAENIMAMAATMFERLYK
jgi:pimeloyl-ACP methyl ester carboxylesterase